MRTIETTLYNFDELSKEAQETAIENVRKTYYEHNDFAEWAIDNCGLFEPPHKELEAMFGKDYNFPMIENTRENVYFSTDRNWYLDCAQAMNITNKEHFLLWLGLSEDLTNKIDFSIFTPSYRGSGTTIQFEFEDEDDETSANNDILEEATEKFESHVNSILRCLEDNIDYRFTDEAVKEDIEANEYEFTEEGELI